MNLDEENPCPHCGYTLTLTDREDGEIKQIIPNELQADFSKSLEEAELAHPFVLPQRDSSGDWESVPSTPLKLRQDLPLEGVFPPSLPDIPLSATEQKVYLQLSVEFHIIMDKAENYRAGLFNWTILLPERLHEYGLTRDAWDRIAAVGDNDEKLQMQLTSLLNKLK